MSTFLVTGGAGFIGSNFLIKMVKKYPNDFFVCLDALTYAGNIHTIESIFNEKNFCFVRGNICNKKTVDLLFKKYKFDYVINFAAESHVDRSLKNPGLFLKTNILGVQVLMDASRKYHAKRFHQVSTDEVYGDLPLDRPDLMFNENYPIKASSPYSSSKASADLLVMAYHRTFKLPVTISRCSNNYGPYQFPEKLIPLLYTKCINNEKLPIYGDGLNVRDWLYVEDHCDAIDLIVRKGRDGEIYNIGGHNEKANIEIARLVLKFFGKDETFINYVKDRPGHDLRYAINAEKIHHELGWFPKTKFEDGIVKTMIWYKNNQQWVNSVISGEYLNWIKLNYKNRI